MRSIEVKIPCPVCGNIVSRDWVNKHISSAANKEKVSLLQKEKKHVNYVISGLKEKQIIKSKKYEER